MNAFRPLSLAALAASFLSSQAAIAAPATPKAVVADFLRDVRSGRDPDAAARYFAPRVLAHQLTAEGPATVERTPAQYAAHVRDFLSLFGPFALTVDELIADGDRVYARWTQRGTHRASLEGETPTGRPLTEVTSVVYRVEDGRIVEYWLQTDRKGMEIQLEENARSSAAGR